MLPEVAEVVGACRNRPKIGSLTATTGCSNASETYALSSSTRAYQLIGKNDVDDGEEEWSEEDEWALAGQKRQDRRSLSQHKLHQ